MQSTAALQLVHSVHGDTSEEIPTPNLRPFRVELIYKGQRLLQIVREPEDAAAGVLGVPEIVCTRFVRKPGNRGIWPISGILSISNLSVFSADGGFDSRRLHQM
jgi:hypothetical protein